MTMKLRDEAIRLRGMRQGAIAERKRLMELFGHLGEELMENAKSLDEFEGQRFECRARMHAGMLVHDVAQICFTEIRSDDFNANIAKIVLDMRAAVGEEEWERIKRESEETLNMEKEMQEEIEVGDIVSQTTLEETELYDVVEQVVKAGRGADDTVKMVSILSKSGDYAGSADDMRKFFDKHGIHPGMRDEEASVCTIGFSDSKQKWFGWSHRAVASYGIGDEGFGGIKIETLEQAHQSACNFAEDVS